MNQTGDSRAKGIVKRDLRNWIGTYSELLKEFSSMFINVKGINKIAKRESFIGKKFKKKSNKFYFRQTKADFSNLTAMISTSDTGKEDSLSNISKSKRIKMNNETASYNNYIHKLKNRTFHYFIVKNDKSITPDDLIIVIFQQHSEKKEDLLVSHTITTIKKHCLERLVQRLNIDSIQGALEEICTAIMWLEGSGKELAVRSKEYKGEYLFKRHIPTKNGALLLKTTAIEDNNELIQDCNLVTWINKNQFKKGQEVTIKEFKFVQMLNYLISDPDIDKLIQSYKNGYEKIKDSDDTKVFMSIHGDLYEYEKFIATLENKKYLDFILEFEKLE